SVVRTTRRTAATRRDRRSPWESAPPVARAGYRPHMARGIGDGETGPVPRVALRRCVLAVCVLQDLDLVPGDDGVVTGSGRLVPWSALELAVGDLDPDSADARPVLAAWLRALQQVGWRSPDDLASRARPVGLPRAH